MKPSNADDVSQAVQVSSEDFIKENQQSSHQLNLAVRSGGHAPNAISANTQGGISIDSNYLRSVAHRKPAREQP